MIGRKVHLMCFPFRAPTDPAALLFFLPPIPVREPEPTGFPRVGSVPPADGPGRGSNVNPAGLSVAAAALTPGIADIKENGQIRRELPENAGGGGCKVGGKMRVARAQERAHLHNTLTCPSRGEICGFPAACFRPCEFGPGRADRQTLGFRKRRRWVPPRRILRPCCSCGVSTL